MNNIKHNKALTYTFFYLSMVFSSAAINPALAESDSRIFPEIEWHTTPNKFQFDKDKFIGQRLTVKCIEAPVDEQFTGVYGTDVYPSKNSICIAALHAGQITKDGGIVTLQLNPGASGYTGSSRNGVETGELPETPRSMVFVDAADVIVTEEIREKYAPRLKWDTKFTRTGFVQKQFVGQRFTLKCPAAPGDLRPRKIYGTDSYAMHSVVCVAAVHAGKITMADGGFVIVQLDPGMPKLVGSIRNEIESNDGPGGHMTISFVNSL